MQLSVFAQIKALKVPRWLYSGGVPVALIDPVTGLPAAAIAEYLWADFINTLDPADFNGKFVRIIDKHSSLNLAGGVVFVGDSTVVPAKWQQVSSGGIVFTNYSEFPAANVARNGWRCWSTAMGIGGQEFYCDGVRWRPLNNIMIAGKRYATFTKSGTAEELISGILIPTNNGKSLLQPGDQIRTISSLYKSGGTSSGFNRFVKTNASLTVSGATQLEASGNSVGAAGGAVYADNLIYERRADVSGNGRLKRIGAVSSNALGGYQTSGSVSMEPAEASITNPDSADFYFFLSVSSTGNTEAITMPNCLFIIETCGA